MSTFSRESKKKGRVEDHQNKLRNSHRKAVEAISGVEARLETKVGQTLGIASCGSE